MVDKPIPIHNSMSIHQPNLQSGVARAGTYVTDADGSNWWVSDDLCYSVRLPNKDTSQKTVLVPAPHENENKDPILLEPTPQPNTLSIILTENYEFSTAVVITVSKKIKNGQPDTLIGILLNFLGKNKTMGEEHYNRLINDHFQQTGIQFNSKFYGNRGAVSSLQWNGDENQHPWLKKIQRQLGNVVSENPNGSITLTPKWDDLISRILV